MATECKVCQNVYHASREHCPVCGASDKFFGVPIPSFTYDASKPGFMLLVAANGAEPVSACPQAPRFLHVRFCDEA
jgi:hypothetical protein